VVVVGHVDRDRDVPLRRTANLVHLKPHHRHGLAVKLGDHVSGEVHRRQPFPENLTVQALDGGGVDVKKFHIWAIILSGEGRRGG